MEIDNTYAPPKAPNRLEPPSTATGQQVWRSGRDVVFVHGAALPPRCIHCNQAAQTWLDQRLVWHRNALYLLLCIGLVLYFVVAVVTRRRARVRVPLCAHHAKRRTRGLIAAWACGAASIVVPIVANGVNAKTIGIIPILSGALLVAAIAIGMATTRLLRATLIDADRVHVRGPCDAWMQELPPVDI